MDLPRSTSPARCSALAPRMATPMASSHMRMRLRLPMLTQSDTAPMVQKLVLCPTAPNTNASRKAPRATLGAMAAAVSIRRSLNAGSVARAIGHGGSLEAGLAQPAGVADAAGAALGVGLVAGHAHRRVHAQFQRQLHNGRL